MALVLDKSSATIQVDKAGAKTAVEVGDDFALLHCTRNVRVGLVNTPGFQDPTNGPGIRLTGKVFVAGNPNSGEDKLGITNFEVALIQVANVLVYEMRFAGRQATEGSMTANLRAAFSPNPCFDGKTVSIDDAFTRAINTVTPVQGPKPGFVISSVHDDSPFVYMPLRSENPSVAAPNFLFSARRDEGFVTFLIARQSRGPVQILSHIGWHIIWHAEFQWKTPTEKPKVFMKTSAFDSGTPVLGEPAAGADLSMAKTPTGKSANELDREAFQAFGNRNTSVLSQSKTRPTDLPSVFF